MCWCLYGSVAWVSRGWPRVTCPWCLWVSWGVGRFLACLQIFMSVCRRAFRMSRVYISGGGVSGRHQYTFKEHDTHNKLHGQNIIVDIKYRFTYGETNLHRNKENCQNIMTRMVDYRGYTEYLIIYKRYTNAYTKQQLQYNKSIIYLFTVFSAIRGQLILLSFKCFVQVTEKFNRKFF